MSSFGVVLFLLFLLNGWELEYGAEGSWVSILFTLLGSCLVFCLSLCLDSAGSVYSI